MTATTATPARGYYYGWNIVGMTALSQAASFGIAINCLSLYIPNWARELHAPVSLLTLCYTVNGFGFCFLGPLAGAIADKRSVRVMMSLGLFICAGLFAFASQAQHAWQLIACFATFAPVGMIIAGHLPSALLVSRWFEKRRGLAIGFSTMGQTLAGAVLPPVLAIILPAIGWRPTFLIIAACLAFIFSPLAYFVLRDRPNSEPGAAEELSAHLAQTETGIEPKVMTMGEIMRVPNFWILLFASVLGGFIASGVSVNLAPLMLSRGFTVAQAGGLISALSLGALGYKLASGYAVDRISGRLVLMLILATGIAGAITVRLAHTYPLLLLGVLLVAGCAAAAVPIATLVARQFGAASFGRAMGMIVFSGTVGVFAPPIVAFMREATNSYDAPLLVLAVCGAVGLATVFFFREKKPA